LISSSPIAGDDGNLLLKKQVDATADDVQTSDRQQEPVLTSSNLLSRLSITDDLDNSSAALPASSSMLRHGTRDIEESTEPDPRCYDFEFTSLPKQKRNKPSYVGPVDVVDEEIGLKAGWRDGEVLHGVLKLRVGLWNLKLACESLHSSV
jgi:hypothetical protein